GNSVIVDAVNAEEEGKDIWRGLADKYRLELVIVEVVLDNQGVHRQRVEARVRGLHGLSEVTWDNVEARRKAFTTWREPTLRLDAAKDVATTVDEAIRYIHARQS